MKLAISSHKSNKEQKSLRKKNSQNKSSLDFQNTLKLTRLDQIEKQEQQKQQEQQEQQEQKGQQQQQKYKLNKNNDPQSLQLSKNKVYLQEYQHQLQQLPLPPQLHINIYPWLTWLFGLVFTIIGLALLAHFIQQLGQHHSQTVQLVLAVLILLLGFSSLYVAKLEVFTIDPLNDLITVTRTNCCYLTKTKTVALSKVFNFTANKKGHSGFYNNTIHYVIRIHIQDQEPIDVLEESSSRKAQKHLLKIQNFLQNEIQVSEMVVFDESSNKYQQGFHHI